MFCRHVLNPLCCKTDADIELDKGRLALDAKKLESSERVKGVEIGSKVSLDKQKMQADQFKEGIKISMDAEKYKKESELKTNNLIVDAIDRALTHSQEEEGRKFEHTKHVDQLTRKHIEDQIQKELNTKPTEE